MLLPMLLVIVNVVSGMQGKASNVEHRVGLASAGTNHAGDYYICPAACCTGCTSITVHYCCAMVDHAPLRNVSISMLLVWHCYIEPSSASVKIGILKASSSGVLYNCLYVVCTVSKGMVGACQRI